MSFHYRERFVPLIIRADADAARGAGHVMRSLALAYAWQARGGFVGFVSARPSAPVRRKIQAAGAAVVELDSAHPNFADVRATIAYIEEVLQQSQQIPWIALDGYHFDRDYQNKLRATGARLLVIDDNAHLPFYDADVILNHGMQAQHLDYRCAADCTLLLGTRYALLRPEFTRAAALERLTPHRARKLLITLGGSDPDNVTEKVLQALALVDGPLEASVVVGPMNPHLKSLQESANRLPYPVQLKTAVQDMSTLMLWADVAVSAAGGTCLELAALGVPTVTLVIAENQELNAAELDKFGAAIHLGWHRQVSLEQTAATLNEVIRSSQAREQMRLRGKTLVDGRGAQRAVEALLEKTNSKAA